MEAFKEQNNLQEKTFIIREFSTGDFGDRGKIIGIIQSFSEESAKSLFKKIRKITDNELAFYSFSEVKYFYPTSTEDVQIENNGWIKIESEADLPKQNGDYFVFTKEKEVRVEMFNTHSKLDNQYYKEKVTHYQPIVKPEHPIY